MSSILIDVLGLQRIFQEVGGFIANIALQIQNYVDGIVFNLSNFISGFTQTILNNLHTAFSTVVNVINTMIVTVRGFVESVLTQIGNALSAGFFGVINLLGNTIARIATEISGIVSAITTELKRLFAPVAAAIGSLINEIKGIGGAIFAAVGEVLVELWNNLTQTFQSTIEAVKGWIRDAWTAITTFTNDLISGVKTLLSDARDFIRNVGSGVINFVRDGITELKGFVIGVVQSLMGFVRTATEEISRVAVTAIEEIVGASSALVGEINKRLGDIKTAFGEAATAVVEGLSGIAEESFGTMGDAVKQISEIIFNLSDPKTVNDFVGRVNTRISDPEFAVRDRAAWASFVQTLNPDSPIQRILWGTLFSAGLGLRVYAGISDAQGQILLQEFATRYHFQLLSPADAAQAYRRQARDTAELTGTIVRQGFSSEDAKTILENTNLVPAIGDLLALWLRGELGDDELRKALFQHGFDERWAGKLERLADVVPPVGDLVTMAVREVFDPQKAAALGLYEEFPEAFGREAAKHGLSRENAERYWAAHWTLPSATQGAEMLQRGEITPDEYDNLLKALDYSPIWRNKLKNIAFNPLTRVDIRRMHKIGVIVDEELVEAYQRIGYDPVDATRLAHFTKQLTAGVSPDDDEELGKLSRSSILGFFDDGLIGETRALELLQTIGQTSEAAKLYIETVKFDNQRAERKAEIGLVLELAAAGVATFDEAHDRLAALGLETVEVQNALAKLLRADQKRIKLPSREEALSLYLDKIIKLEEYKDLLSRLGFSAKWIVAFLKQAEAIKNAD